MRGENHKFGNCVKCRSHVGAFEGFAVKVEKDWKIICRLCDPPAEAPASSSRSIRRQCVVCNDWKRIEIPSSVCKSCLAKD